MVLEDGQLFAQQSVPLALDRAEFERLYQGCFQVFQLPRFGDVREDETRVDRVDGVVQLGVGGGQHSHDARMLTSHPTQQVDAAHVWHSLVGDQDRDVLCVFGEHFESVLCTTARQNFYDSIQCHSEVLQRLLFVVHVQHLNTFVLAFIRH